MQVSSTATSVVVAIPAFNESTTVEGLVLSIVGEPWDETFRLSSVLVVDDESDDGTAEIADRLAAELPVVRAFHNRPRSGKNAGIRVGLEHARELGADVLVVLDADVRLRPGAIVETVRLLIERSDLGGTSCVNEPLPPKSIWERASVFQARMLVEVARTGAGPLQRLFALRVASLDGLELPDTTHDDMYISRWLLRSGYGTASARSAAVEVRASTGLRDFAKQTLRTREAVKALDDVLAAPASPIAVRGLRPIDMARAARRDPVGALIYAAWLGVALLTPRRWWLPTVNFTKYDQSASTKVLD